MQITLNGQTVSAGTALDAYLSTFSPEELELYLPQRAMVFAEALYLRKGPREAIAKAGIFVEVVQ